MRWTTLLAPSLLLAASSTSATPLQRRADKPVCDAFLPASYDLSVRNCLASPVTGIESPDERGYIQQNPFCSPFNNTRFCAPRYTAVVWSPQPLYTNSTVIVTTTPPVVSPPIFANNPTLLRSLGAADASALRTYVNLTAPDLSPSHPEVPIQLFLIEVYNVTDAATGLRETRQRVYQGPNVTLVWYPDAVEDALRSTPGYDDDHDLSTGAIAGIAVALLVLVVVCVSCCCCCCKKRRRPKTTSAEAAASTTGGPVDSGDGAAVRRAQGWFRWQEERRRDEAAAADAEPRTTEPTPVVVETKAAADDGPRMPPPTYNEAVRGEASRSVSSPSGPSIMDRGRGY